MDNGRPGSHITELTLQVHGKASLNELTAVLAEIAGVEGVVAEDVDGRGE